MSQMPTRAGRTQLFYTPGNGGGTPPPSSVLQSGKVALVAGQQSYAIVFSPAFLSAPSFVGAQIQMPTDSGEALVAAVDLSSLTAAGVTVWLNGVPTAASNGGYLNWIAHL